MTAQEINLHAAYLYKACVEQKDCLACQIPQNQDGTCIFPKNWKIEEEQLSPEYLSDSEFDELNVENVQSLYRLNSLKNKADNLIGKRFWSKIPNGNFVALKIIGKEQSKIHSFKDRLSCMRWLSGWSMEAVRDFENIEFKTPPEQIRPILGYLRGKLADES